MRKHTNEKGEVAVLYSPGYGAGWFTWNRNYPECIYSPEIVKWVIHGRIGPAPDCQELFGKDFYEGGLDQLVFRWLTPGTAFQVSEYDGSESLRVRDREDWHIA